MSNERFEGVIDLIIHDLEKLIKNDELTETARGHIHRMTRPAVIQEIDSAGITPQQIQAFVYVVTRRPDVLKMVLEIYARIRAMPQE